MRYVAALFSLCIVPSIANSHHSVAHFYDRNNVIEHRGEVISVLWRNPHVRFDTRDENGNVWSIEMGSVSTLERSGIARQMFQEGDVIRVAGSAGRLAEYALFATNILLPDGREMVMGGDDAKPRWSNRTLVQGQQATISEAAARAAEDSADGLFRVWTRETPSVARSVSFTDAAIAARERWDALKDDPTLRCIAPGMIEAMTSPYPIELAQDGEDIIIRMEEWDGRRRIHMNRSAPPENQPASPLGYSVGRWDGDALVVATTRINWPLFDSRGTPQSDQVAMVERFTISDDEQRMTWEVVITDPVNLTEPAVQRMEYEWIPGEEIKRYNCTLLP